MKPDHTPKTRSVWPTYMSKLSAKSWHE